MDDFEQPAFNDPFRMWKFRENRSSSSMFPGVDKNCKEINVFS